MTLAELISLKGHPVLVVSRFEFVEEEDGFKLLTLYGVGGLPDALSSEGRHLEEHWLLFVSDYHFLREVEVHFSSLRSNPDLDSSLFLSRDSKGTEFEIAQVIPGGQVPEVVDLRANMVKLVTEVSRKPNRSK